MVPVSTADWLVKVADTEVGPLNVKVYGLEYVAPLTVNPEKTEPEPGVATSVTVPAGRVLVQVEPPPLFEQEMPSGLEVTVPVPVPFRVTLTERPKSATSFSKYEDRCEYCAPFPRHPWSWTYRNPGGP